jgi:eukaryotic-like serine/threonine-protein kinase
VNKQIGDRYELSERLGHGGMATVYRAHDRKLDREVAIKVLADNFAGDDELRKRFSREARLAAKLDHPNVVQVFDVGEEDGRPFIVMEYVEGGTVGDRLERRRRSLATNEALQLLNQLCDGLGHAHAKKLVHRDIKPQNLLLRESDGCLKITDFGIARAGEETTRLTHPGKVIGTDRYMAPEQLADGKITPAVDVYACGVVADEILPDARPPELREIVERCMRFEPDDRFTDARALGEALQEVEGNGAPVTVRRIKSGGARTKLLPPTGGRTASWPAPRSRVPGLRKGARILAVLAILAVAAVATTAAILSLSSGGSDQPSTTTRAKQPTFPTSVPPSGDPATQARNLADFFRLEARAAKQQATTPP